MESRFDSAGGDVENLGGILVFHLLHVDEKQGPAYIFGKPLEGGDDGLIGEGIERGGEGGSIGRRGGRGREIEVAVASHVIEVDGAYPPTGGPGRGADAIDPGVPENRRQPRLGVGRRVKRVHRVKSFHESFLDEVLGIRLRLREKRRGAKQHGAQGPDVAVEPFGGLGVGHASSNGPVGL